MDGLFDEFSGLDASWLAQEDLTIKVLEEAANQLENNVLCAEQKEKLAGLSGGWKKSHVLISRFGKSFDKSPKIDLFETLPAKDVTKSNREVNNFEEEMAILEAIIQHYYREGVFEVGDAIAAELTNMGVESHILDKISDMKTPFLEMHNLLVALGKKRDIAPAIQWAEEKDTILGAVGVRLRFQLHCLKIISLIRDLPNFKSNTKEKSDLLPTTGCTLLDIINYARHYLEPFYETFPRDIETLMGALAFAPGLETSAYSSLLVDDLWGEAEDALVSAYCGSLGLANQSPLRLVHSVGIYSWPKISRVLSLMRSRPGVAAEWCESGTLENCSELPVEIDVGRDNRFHSVFVCPVLRHQTTEENPPSMLSCGHVISKEALTRLSKGNTNLRIKCPYCPAETTASQSLILHF